MWLWQSIRYVSQNCWDTQYDILCNGNEFLMIFDVVFYLLVIVTKFYQESEIAFKPTKTTLSSLIF